MDETTLRKQLYDQAVERGSSDPVKEARDAYNFIIKGTGSRRRKAAVALTKTPLEQAIDEKVAQDAAAVDPARFNMTLTHEPDEGDDLDDAKHAAQVELEAGAPAGDIPL